MGDESARRHWRRSRRWMWVTVAAWLATAVALPLVVNQLNLFRAAGYQLGFFAVAQGAAVLATILTLLLVWRQEAVDRADRAGRQGDGERPLP